MKKLIVLMAMPMFFAACSDSASYGRKPEDKNATQSNQGENIVQGQSSQAPVANAVSAQIQKISLPKVYKMAEIDEQDMTEAEKAEIKAELGAIIGAVEMLGGGVMDSYMLLDNGNLTHVHFEPDYDEYIRADLNLVNGFGSYLDCIGGIFKKQGEPTTKIKIYHDKKYASRLKSASDKELVLDEGDGPVLYKRVSNEAEILEKIQKFKRTCNSQKVF